MRKLNNRGFTLVEVIAVVVVMAILAIILIPNVTGYLNKGRDEAEEGLKKSILIAAKEYVNDNKYDNEMDLNKVYVVTLIEEGYLSVSDNDRNILNPSDNNQKLDLDVTYVSVEFNNGTKMYEVGDVVLEWKERD